ncbi:hypothetical protein J2S89_003303 [Arthrobacter bambusae]|nr:hypothetical protein [Arthrobacter bambusae]MDQ0099664.1 hypothetical protein [Arthrobacter bambusae]
MEHALPYIDINPYRNPTRKRFKYAGLFVLLCITAAVVYLALSR